MVVETLFWYWSHTEHPIINMRKCSDVCLVDLSSEDEDEDEEADLKVPTFLFWL